MDEIQQALLDAARPSRQSHQGEQLRLEFVGSTEGGRLVKVIAQRRGPDTLRPITAWEVVNHMNETGTHYNPRMTEAEEFAATEGMTPDQEREFYRLGDPITWRPTDSQTLGTNVSPALRSVFSVRFSAGELDEIRARAEAQGQKTGAYVRQVVLADARGTSFEEDPTDEIVQAILHIARATPALDIPKLNRRLRALPTPSPERVPTAAAGRGRTALGSSRTSASRRVSKRDQAANPSATEATAPETVRKQRSSDQ